MARLDPKTRHALRNLDGAIEYLIERLDQRGVLAPITNGRAQVVIEDDIAARANADANEIRTLADRIK